jgi:two-component system OmpR family response regulator
VEKQDKKILVVEDSKNYLWIISQSLIKEGFVVVTAKNGDEGFAAAKEENPDLIISDIVMPNMDGIAMAKKLKEAKIDTPIIFLTNMSDLKNTSAASEFAEEYIIKSEMSIDEIVARVKSRFNFK